MAPRSLLPHIMTQEPHTVTCIGEGFQLWIERGNQWQLAALNPQIQAQKSLNQKDQNTRRFRISSEPSVARGNFFEHMELKKGRHTFAQAPKLLYPTFFGFQVDAAQGCGSCGASGEDGERSRSHKRPQVAWHFIDSFRMPVTLGPCRDQQG